MSEPIHDALGPIEHFAERIIIGAEQDLDAARRQWQRITHHKQSQPYHQDNTGTIPQENPVSLATFEATIKDDVAIGISKAEDLVSHLKTVAESHLGLLQEIQASPIAQAVEGFILPPEAEQFIADMVTTLASKYGTPKPVDPAAPAVHDAAGEAPAPAAA